MLFTFYFVNIKHTLLPMLLMLHILRILNPEIGNIIYFV